MGSLKHLIKRAMPLKWRREIRKRALPLTVTHLHGPARVQLRSDEAIVHLRGQERRILHGVVH